MAMLIMHNAQISISDIAKNRPCETREVFEIAPSKLVHADTYRHCCIYAIYHFLTQARAEDTDHFSNHGLGGVNQQEHEGLHLASSTMYLELPPPFFPL